MDGDYTLREISDRIRIEELIHREARAIDTRDWTLWASCFTEDALIDWRENEGVLARRDEAGAWLSRICETLPFPAYQHLCTNIEITLRGDAAEARTTQLIPISLPSPAGGRQIAFSGIWFDDAVVRIDGAWKIAARVEHQAWRHNFPAAYQTPEV